MKKIIMIILLPLISQVDMFSQSRDSCLPEGIIFSRQSQVDSFQVSYPGCTEIGGNVTIKGESIVSLSALAPLTAIGGYLWLYDTPLASLSGLDNLVSTGGLFVGDPNLGGLNNLVTLEGLGNLTEIHGVFSIQANVSLASLTGLESLISIEGDLYINGNPSLAGCSLQGLCDYLSAPAGSVNIFNNGPGCDDPPALAAGCGIELHCLIYGNYYMLTQENVDNFAFNYLGCNELQGNLTVMGDGISNLTGLSGIISVGGDLRIAADSSLASLGGLDALNYVGGFLEISGCKHLLSLEGLGSLATVGGDLSIGVHWAGNGELAGLDGLSSLEAIGGNLSIVENPALNSLSGLSGLSSLGGGITVTGNSILESLSGLEGLTSAGGNLIIGDNPGLQDLDGLENIGSIAGQVQIYWNSNLAGIGGLQNIDSATVTSLSIHNNASLSECDVESVCSYLAGAGGPVEIHGNADGCRNPFQVAEACGQAFPCVPGNYYFFSQGDIDDFQAYSDCAIIEGNVLVRGNNIVSLQGLGSITQILGGLEISDCPLLESLGGLENLTSVGGSLSIHNDSSLIDLSGLDNLISTGDLSIVGNAALVSLDGLEQLTAVSGGIRIGSYNSGLTSIDGIRSVQAGSVSYLTIIDNENLSACNVESVCGILSYPNGTVTIYGNGEGCGSVEEVEVACGVGIDPLAVSRWPFAVECYPNPTEGTIDFRLSIFDCRFVSLKVYDVHGREIAVVFEGETDEGEQTIRWNAKDAPAGIYFYRLINADKNIMTSGKIIRY